MITTINIYKVGGISQQMNGGNIAKTHRFIASGESSFTCFMSSISPFLFTNH